MRVVFAGTPEFAVTILAALLDAAHEVACVYTQPDRPAGRGRALKASAVKVLAQRHGLTVRQPASLRPKESIDALAEFTPEIMVVAAYGLLLPAGILAVPTLGCVNVHASLLPRWRGAAPIQRAILAGDKQTGISIMQMDEGLDTGAVLARASLNIEPGDTAASLSERLAQLGAKTLIETLAVMEKGAIEAIPQDEDQATHAPRIDKREAELDWSLSAEELERRVRGFNPWPVAFSYLPGSGDPNPRRLRVWLARVRDHGKASATPGSIVSAGAEGIAVATGDGVLLLKEVQVPGSRVMSAADFLNARALAPGAKLGDA